jgi:hypothetical protein
MLARCLHKSREPRHREYSSYLKQFDRGVALSEFRTASFQSWHPQRREMLGPPVAETPQLHLVAMPAAQAAVYIFSEPVASGSFRPQTGELIVFSQDVGGGEFHQLYRYDLADGTIVAHHGTSRNTGHGGPKRTLAGLHLHPPERQGQRCLCHQPGAWRQIVCSSRFLAAAGVSDWSEDDFQIVGEYISINESYLYLADAQTGTKELLTPKGGEKIFYGMARFANDSKSIYVTSDRDSEFQRLGRIDLATRQFTPLTSDLPWDVTEFELSPEGKLIAFVTNEDGASVLRVIDAKRGKEIRIPRIPVSAISGLVPYQNGRDLGFN